MTEQGIQNVPESILDKFLGVWRHIAEPLPAGAPSTLVFHNTIFFIEFWILSIHGQGFPLEVFYHGFLVPCVFPLDEDVEFVLSVLFDRHSSKEIVDIPKFVFLVIFGCLFIPRHALAVEELVRFRRWNNGGVKGW